MRANVFNKWKFSHAKEMRPGALLRQMDANVSMCEFITLLKSGRNCPDKLHGRFGPLCVANIVGLCLDLTQTHIKDFRKYSFSREDVRTSSSRKRGTMSFGCN